ncbi:MAG: MFS transporter [Rhodospirillaceae bacterium]|nr:MFS transporter [Rhodospirillaceae bacterium]MBT4939430.1 MFS transporter [Rhodospirillaceae bacterium]MBT5939463.1 MFS transporter [Rhodospirillaceae bacterium]MBT7268948.1 MFS transporter [Rhodospirillaceae bacterium]
MSDEISSEATIKTKAGRVAFQHADYRWFWLARVLGVFAIDMQITAVSWQVYQLTGKPLDLGLVGLAQFAPFFCLFLVSGTVADRYQRKRIMSICVSIQTLCAVAFFVMTMTGNANFPTIFTILIFLGIARAFQSPAQQAIVPLLVPKEHFANAVAWTASGFQMARIAGPGIAGLMIIAGEEWVYGTAMILFFLSTIFTFFIKTNTQVISRAPINVENILAGFKFIMKRQIIIGSIGLDLFAVLLGGATALLPIFATDILNVGSAGFGALRATHMVGAFTTALILTQHPISRHAGKKLLYAVAIFGAGIIVFGISTSFWLSIGALFVLGAADSVSVFVRNNLVQIITPDNMRGRVSAVSSVFVGASNEVGEFESGVTAEWWGVVPAVVVGGVGTIFIAGLFAKIFPELREVDSLNPDDLVRKYQKMES